MGKYNGNDVNVDSLPFIGLNPKTKHPRWLIGALDRLSDNDAEKLLKINVEGFDVLKDMEFDVVYDSRNHYKDVFSNIPSVLNAENNEVYREGIIYLKIGKFALIMFMDYINIECKDCEILEIVHYF